MITLVGTQTDFVDALNDLLEMEFEALEIYDAAIHRLDKEDYRDKLREFKEDHEKHVKDLTDYLEKIGEEPSKKPSGKQVLPISIISLKSLIGDKSILKTMVSVEEDTNKAYERMNKHSDKHEKSADMIKEFYNDEKKHKAWLEKETSK
jgi:uncharacterized protein (TIGR02284 family)